MLELAVQIGLWLIKKFVKKSATKEMLTKQMLQSIVIMHNGVLDTAQISTMAHDTLSTLKEKIAALDNPKPV